MTIYLHCSSQNYPCKLTEVGVGTSRGRPKKKKKEHSKRRLYENIPMQYKAFLDAVKIENFVRKNLIILKCLSKSLAEVGVGTSEKT